MTKDLILKSKDILETWLMWKVNTSEIPFNVATKIILTTEKGEYVKQVNVVKIINKPVDIDSLRGSGSQKIWVETTSVINIDTFEVLRTFTESESLLSFMEKK